MIYPCPKPPKVVKAKKRMKRYNSKRKGSAFPKVRNKAYRDWVRLENACLLSDRGGTPGRVSLYDYELANRSGFIHNCWGHVTPAHVGKHQARGAPDFGCIVPLCEIAHQFYDEHRSEWKRATGLSEREMASRASGYALKYAERGG